MRTALIRPKSTACCRQRRTSLRAPFARLQQWVWVLTIGLIGSVPLAPSSHAAGRNPYGGSVSVPVSTFAGIRDPHLATDQGGRFGALLAHCRLLRRVGSGQIVGELAEDERTFERGQMTLRLRRGPTFHNGRHITSKSVARSLNRYRGLGRSPWIRSLVSSLRITQPDPRTLVVEAPGRRAKGRILAELLARPELAVVQTSRRGGELSGCGAFRPVGQTSSAIDLEAFEGHALGRPWIDRIKVTRFQDLKSEINAFRFSPLDLTFVSSDRYETPQVESMHAYSTLFLVPAPHLRTDRYVDLRHTIFRALRSAPLARDIETKGTPSPAKGIWPPHLAPSRRGLPRARSARWDRTMLIHYPRGSDEWRLVAASVRDTLQGHFGTTVSALPADGLTPYTASSARRPPWDFALVVLDWSAHTQEQAAYEAMVALGLPDLPPSRYFAGHVKAWASKQNARLRAIPLLHIERKLFHKGRSALAPGVEIPRLSDSWVIK